MMLNKPNLHDPFTKKLAIFFLVITFVMIIFPPYHRITHPTIPGDSFLGYWSIASSKWNGTKGVSIDYGRLALQEIGLIVLCGAVYIWKKE